MRLRLLLPCLLAQITGAPRQVFSYSEIQWADKSWTHNTFRFYELTFGRRDGIKAEMSATSWRDESGIHVIYACHSWESIFALSEQYIRTFLSSWHRVRLPVRVWIPILQTAQGPTFASPYLFAIAVDTASDFRNGSAASPQNTTFTCTGLNLMLVAMTVEASRNADDITGITYNSVAMTNIAHISTAFAGAGTVWYQLGPSTGSHTLSVTFTGGSAIVEGALASYSGVKQSGQPDASVTGGSGATTTITQSLTSVANNCWFIFALCTGRALTASTGSTLRSGGTNAVGSYLFDSNAAITPAGSYSMTVTQSTNSDEAFCMFSIAPFGAATVHRLPLLGVGT